MIYPNITLNSVNPLHIAKTHKGYIITEYGQNDRHVQGHETLHNIIPSFFHRKDKIVILTGFTHPHTHFNAGIFVHHNPPLLQHYKIIKTLASLSFDQLFKNLKTHDHHVNTDKTPLIFNKKITYSIQLEEIDEALEGLNFSLYQNNACHEDSLYAVYNTHNFQKFETEYQFYNGPLENLSETDWTKMLSEVLLVHDITEHEKITILKKIDVNSLQRFKDYTLNCVALYTTLRKNMKNLKTLLT